ncbi:Uncharacterised protein [uncultured archaeon]|nr:Uncharacterised protein [uncultured archaeon]
MLEELTARIQKIFLPKDVSLPVAEANIIKDMWISCSSETAKALSETINSKVEVNSASPDILLINGVPKLLNPNNTATIVLWVKTLGNVSGVVVLSSTLKDMLALADRLLKKERGYFKDLSKENTSVIKELADLIAGYFVTALNKLLNTTYGLTPPKLSVNLYRAIEEFGLGKVYTEEVRVLMLKASFGIIEENIKLDMVVLFRKENVEKIVELININHFQPPVEIMPRSGKLFSKS